MHVWFRARSLPLLWTRQLLRLRASSLYPRGLDLRFHSFRYVAPCLAIVVKVQWHVFLTPMPQTELNRILEQYPDTLSIKTTGFAIFLETIRYRYYCIFMVR